MHISFVHRRNHFAATIYQSSAKVLIYATYRLKKEGVITDVMNYTPQEALSSVHQAFAYLQASESEIIKFRPKSVQF